MASLEHGLRFMGPAQQQFDSIKEQAKYFLNNFWTNWNNYDEPQSYIMPPVFYYKHPEISDAACGLEGKDEDDIDKEEAKCESEIGKKKQPNYITDRLSDKQKHRVYIALQQLIKEGVRSPFIAVRGLDLQLNYKDQDKKSRELQGALVKIFPHVQWEEYLRLMAEAFDKEKPSTAYDFVLIGPKIGLVMIELNCSRFQKGFQDRSLPTTYKEYLGRLNSSKALIYLLKQATMKEEEPNVRKILCTPHLKKVRYDDWLTNLTEEERVHVKENKIGDVIQIFREDMGNLKQLLQSVLENCSETHNAKTMYEAYAPIISAIASVTVLKSKDHQQPQQPVELKCVKFSEYGAVLKDGSCIKNQNPLEGQVPKLTQGSNLKWASAKAQKAASQEAASKEQIVDTDSCGDEILPPVQSTGMPKVIFLSPDQQTALKGPQRQFLVGAAGTGKTIVLQAKALELLSKNQSVAVLAPKSYMLGYKRLFEHYEELKYKIFYWPIETTKETYKLITKLGDEKSDRVLEIINDYVDEEIETRKEELLRSFNWLFSFDNVIIDDAFDKDDLDFVRPERFFVAPLLTMVLARRLCPQKLVWAALDFHTAYSVSYPYRKDDGYKTTVSDILMQNSEKSNFSVAILKQVMRCTGNIFNAAYEPKNWRQEVVPSPGHKIQGIQVTEVKKNYSTYQRALDALWKKVNSEIEQLSNRGRCANNFAIVVGTFEESYSTLKHFLKEKCKKYWPQLFDEKNDLESFVELSPETQLPSNENALTIEAWHGVSSLEWPVVIYVSCLPKNLDDTSADYVEYQRYRAMSRATSALIDISLTYDRKEDIVEGAEKMDQSPSMSLIDGWNLELKFLGKIPDTSGPLELTVKRMETSPPLEFDKTYYHNCTKPKGKALLINNELFSDQYFPNRLGSKVDFENMQKLSMALGYAVTQCENLTASELRMVVKDFVDSLDSSPFFGESCFVYISTYAKDGNFLGVDGSRMKMSSFFQPIIECKKLKEKPKIFIVQACREPARIDIEASTEEEILDEIEECEWKAQEDFLKNVPNADDTCILHCTTPGYYNWCKGGEHGSWFVQSICETFAEHAHEMWADLTTLTTLANKKLHDAYDEQSCLLLMNATSMNVRRLFQFLPEQSCQNCKEARETAMSKLKEIWEKKKRDAHADTEPEHDETSTQQDVQRPELPSQDSDKKGKTSAPYREYHLFNRAIEAK